MTFSIGDYFKTMIKEGKTDKFIAAMDLNRYLLTNEFIEELAIEAAECGNLTLVEKLFEENSVLQEYTYGPGNGAAKNGHKDITLFITDIVISYCDDEWRKKLLNDMVMFAEEGGHHQLAEEIRKLV